MAKNVNGKHPEEIISQTTDSVSISVRYSAMSNAIERFTFHNREETIWQKSFINDNLSKRRFSGMLAEKCNELKSG